MNRFVESASMLKLGEKADLMLIKAAHIWDINDFKDDTVKMTEERAIELGVEEFADYYTLVPYELEP